MGMFPLHGPVENEAPAIPCDKTEIDKTTVVYLYVLSLHSRSTVLGGNIYSWVAAASVKNRRKLREPAVQVGAVLSAQTSDIRLVRCTNCIPYSFIVPGYGYNR